VHTYTNPHSPGTYSARSGRGVESCIRCARGTYSGIGASSCEVMISCFPLNQVSTSAYSADRFLGSSSSGVTYEQALDMEVSTDYVASFPGSIDQHITFQTDCTGLPGAELGITFWVKVAALDQYFFIGCFGQGLGWYVGTSGSRNNFAFVLTSTSSPFPTLVASSEQMIETNRWYHVAATYDGRTMSLYTDGVLTRSSTLQSGPIAYPTSDAAFMLGRYKDSTTEMYFRGMCMQMRHLPRALILCVCLYVYKYAHIHAGSMDDVTLWGKAISLDIISQIYRDQTTQAYFCCPKACPAGQISKNLCSGMLITAGCLYVCV
jgi:hypothetical protein